MRSQQDQAGRHDQPSQHVRLQRTCREWPSYRRIVKTLDELALSHVTSPRTCLAQSLNYSSLEPPASEKCQLPVSGADEVQCLVRVKSDGSTMSALLSR